MVILRVGIGSASCGTGVSAGTSSRLPDEWRWETRTDSRAPAVCPPLVLRSPSLGCLLLQRRGGRDGSHQPVPLPERNKDTTYQRMLACPVARARAFVGPDWAARLQELRMDLGACWIFGSLRLNLLRFSRPQRACASGP